MLSKDCHKHEVQRQLLQLTILVKAGEKIMSEFYFLAKILSNPIFVGFGAILYSCIPATITLIPSQHQL